MCTCKNIYMYIRMYMYRTKINIFVWVCARARMCV